MKNNPFIFPCIILALTAIMYCIAFHQERDKNKKLEQTIEQLRKNGKL